MGAFGESAKHQTFSQINRTKLEQINGTNTFTLTLIKIIAATHEIIDVVKLYKHCFIEFKLY